MSGLFPSVPVESITSRIFLVRGQKIMLDSDLAELYGVSTSRLNEQVRRNIDRFPNDFMFQLTDSLEIANCDIKLGRSTETPTGIHGTGSVNALQCAAQRTGHPSQYCHHAGLFQLREMLSAHKELALKLSELERKVGIHDQTIVQLIEAIRNIMETPVRETKPIGFISDSKA